MKPEILVYTAFTETSRNALEYACRMALDRGFSLLLAHNYDPPLNYAADAVAFSAIHESFDGTEEKIKGEIEWAVSSFPDINIRYRLTFGRRADAVKEVFSEYKIDFMIVGAPESEGEFWGWNDDFVDTINSMPVPALIIPRTVTYQAITQVGFASDYARPLSKEQLDFIKRIIHEGPAQLHIIHVSVPQLTDKDKRLKHRADLEQELTAYKPVYASIENTDVVATIIRYVQEWSIQLLIVIPRRHGIWYSIFNQRHSRRLTRINHLPIITLQE